MSSLQHAVLPRHGVVIHLAHQRCRGLHLRRAMPCGPFFHIFQRGCLFFVGMYDDKFPISQMVVRRGFES